MTLVGAPRVEADPPPAGPAPPIVANGGFEQWQPAPDWLRRSMDCPQVPTGWSVQPAHEPAGCSLASDAAVKHGGRCSVRLGDTHTKGVLAIAQRLAVEPEYRYLIRVWLKGQRIDAYHPKGVIVHLTASSQTDKNDAGLWSGLLRHADKVSPPNNGTFDWHELVSTFDTPIGTRSLLLLVELRGAGVLWVDDIQVTRLERSVQVESY
jgi:hypothetical protein